MSKLLEINHCRKQFGSNEVLTDLTLSVEEGQVLSIIGPSGSGKSTLLRCATLLETMDGGDLISVLKNVMEAPMLVQKRQEKEVKEEALALLDQMGLSDKADAYPYQLSGGQQQRVSIARALAMNPKILFFDEPTSALDPELTGEILRVIRKLAEKKMTMVIVTHEMAFARDVSDWVVFMNGGVIIEEGDPREVIDHPTHERTIQFLRRLQEQ